MKNRRLCPCSAGSATVSLTRLYPNGLPVRLGHGSRRRLIGARSSALSTGHLLASCLLQTDSSPCGGSRRRDENPRPLVVIGRRSAPASASPSRGPGNGILRAETGGRIQAQNAGEQSEFGSQTTLRLTNPPELRGFLSTRKPPRFVGTARRNRTDDLFNANFGRVETTAAHADYLVGDAGIELMAIAAWHPFKTRRRSEDRSKYGGGPERNGRANSDGAPPRHEDRTRDRIAPTRSGRQVGRADRRHWVVAAYRASRADRPSPSRLRRPPGAWRNRPRLGLPPSRLSRPARDPNATEPEELDAAADQFGRRAAWTDRRRQPRPEQLRGDERSRNRG